MNIVKYGPSVTNSSCSRCVDVSRLFTEIVYITYTQPNYYGSGCCEVHLRTMHLMQSIYRHTRKLTISNFFERSMSIA